MKNNRVCKLFEIDYPIIQGGMIWCSGWKLASAVSQAGGLGLIGSGSMNPEILKEHIQKTRNETNKPFGVNVPLLYPKVDKIMEVIIREKVKIVFTSAGNPQTWTKILQENGIKVAHVVANKKYALKSQDAGVDAIVAEGYEAGGHNGREETTTMVLIPFLRELVDIPLIAAGGISSGRAMLASMVLGAEGVQMGSRFVASLESSAHDNFKHEIIKLSDGGTNITLRKLVPVRLVKNKFYQHITEQENGGASVTELIELLGKGRSKKGMFEGDMVEGELEIGQVASSINAILPVQQIIENIVKEYNDLVRYCENLRL